MNNEHLKPFIARGVVRVPDFHPKTHQLSALEILLTLRPGWGADKPARYTRALPGGGIKIEDFSGFISQGNLEDPDYIPTTEELIAAGAETVKRRLLEELKLIAVGFFYVATSTNYRSKDKWKTVAYAVDLTEKPDVWVKSDSAGTLWMPQDQILNHRPRLLSGNLVAARKGIAALDAKKSAA
jgi:hypothetical protein